MVETVLHDVRYALRTLGRMRGVAFVAVLMLALGALVAWRLLRGWLIGVADLDPRLLVFVAAAMALVASAAALLPARRASAVDPAIVLRNL